jgi:hypothetical protein
MPLSFAADILPLFRDEPDIMAMKRYGLDLSSHEEVREKAKEIYETLESRLRVVDAETRIGDGPVRSLQLRLRNSKCR